MIGIYGGTFDPVHNGHLRPAVDVLTELRLDELKIIPCGQPAHREQPVATAEQRLAMLNLAINEQPGFVVDEREIKRQGRSYMIDTLDSLQQEFPDEIFCLIIGMDAFLSFDSWKDWQTILDKYPLVVTHRPGYDGDPMKNQNPNEDLKRYVDLHQINDPKAFVKVKAPAVYFCAVTQLDISSTRIRELVAQKNSIHYLVPDPVVEFIQQQHLYD